MKKNHKITVFTGPGNTGKSSLIETLNKEGSYKVYKEIARQHFDKADNMKKFQKTILEDEKKRLFELFAYTGKKDILIDRTFADNLVYLYWNIINGKLENEFDFGELASDIADSIDIYDEVILFTEPFKNSNRFEDYNSSNFNKLFVTTIRTIYGDKVKEYKNAKEYLNLNK